MNGVKKSFLKKLFDKRSLILFLGFFISFILRVLRLPRDYPFIGAQGLITDEGDWIHNVRNLYISGKVILDDLNWSYYAGIFSFYLKSFSVSLFGLKIWAIRIPDFIFGFLSLILFYLLSLKFLEKRKAIIGTILFGINNLFIVYSTVAINESALLFFFILSIFTYISKNKKFSFLSGLSAFLSFLMKSSAFYLLFLYLFLFLKEKSVKKFFLFVLGFIVPSILYLIFFVFPDFNLWLINNFLPGHLYWNWKYYLGNIHYISQNSFFAFTTPYTLVFYIYSVFNNKKFLPLSLIFGFFIIFILAVPQPDWRFLPILPFIIIVLCDSLFKEWNFPSDLKLFRRILIMYPLWAYLNIILYLILSVHLKIKIDVIKEVNPVYNLSFFTFPLFLLSFIKGNKKIWRMIFTLSLFSLTGIFLSYLLYFILNFSGIYPPHNNFFLFLLPFILILSLIFKIDRIKINKFYLSGIILFEVLQILTWLPYKENSIRKFSREIKSYVDGNVVLSIVEPLLFETQALVFRYSPGNEVNENIFEKYSPKFALTVEKWQTRKFDPYRIIFTDNKSSVKSLYSILFKRDLLFYGWSGKIPRTGVCLLVRK